MQELRSTEILDKEILNDAAKKAENIRKKTEDDVSQIIASVDDDVAAAEKDKEVYYSEKLLAFKKDKDAAAPLEKQRMKVSFIQTSMMSKINSYLSSLTEKKRLELVLSLLPSDYIIRVVEESETENKLTAYIYGFDFNAAKTAINKEYKKVISGYKQVDFGEIVPEETYSLEKENLKGIILESEDKNYRYRLTISEALGSVLDKDRAELAEALFGGLN